MPLAMLVGTEIRAEDGTLSNLRKNEFGDLYDPGVSSIAPPKASSLSNAKTYTQGLCEALNQHQIELVSTGQQEIADQYEIILENIWVNRCQDGTPWQTRQTSIHHACGHHSGRSLVA
jgi:hypothetical protein